MAAGVPYWGNHWSHLYYSMDKACCYPSLSQCTAYRSSFHSRSLGKAIEGYRSRQIGHSLWRYSEPQELRQIHTKIQPGSWTLPCFVFWNHMKRLLMILSGCTKYQYTYLLSYSLWLNSSYNGCTTVGINFHNVMYLWEHDNIQLPCNRLILVLVSMHCTPLHIR